MNAGGRGIINTADIDSKTLLPKIDPTTNTAFTAARNWTAPRDPLVLDLDGDGIEAVGINPASPILFDHDGDGSKNGTGWIKADDGIVVLDRNGNGLIDSGLELFGDNTVLAHGPKAGQTAANGYEALADLDLNGDGALNSADTAYGQLRIWQDANQDGVSQAAELKTLAELGIASINTTGTASSVNLGNGNTQPFSGSFTRTNGTTGTSGVAEVTGSLLLASNNFYREFTDDPVVTAAAAALPQMGGSGWTRDLREAMSLGTSEAADLQVKVSAFAAATTRDAQMALLDGVITAWAESSGKLVHDIWHYDLASVGGFWVSTDHVPGEFFPRGTLTITPQGMEETVNVGGNQTVVLTAQGAQVLQRLNLLEVFNGTKFLQSAQSSQSIITVGEGGSGSSIGGGGESSAAVILTGTLSTAQIALLNQAYADLQESVYNALVVQTRLQPYLETIGLVIDDSGIRFDTTALAAKLDAALVTDLRNGLSDLVDLNLKAQDTLQAVGFDGLGRLRIAIAALPADSPLRAELVDWHVLMAGGSGTAHADIYLGDAGGNHFSAGAGDDSMYGGDGDDTLFGNAGNDMLEGGTGNDMLWGGGFEGGAGNDSYLFGRGDGQDTIRDQDGTAGNVDKLVFKAGIAAADVVVSREYNTLELKFKGTSDKVRIHNYFNGDGAAGNAVEEIHFTDAPGTVWSVADVKAMALQGTVGDDNLIGYATDDILDGGAGNDTLAGGTYANSTGNDTYHFGRGDGQDSIREEDNTVDNVDKIVFKTGVAVTDVQVSRDGDALVLKIRGTSDQIRVDGYFENFESEDATYAYQIEEIRFVDAPDTVWSVADVMAQALMGGVGDDILQGYASDDTLSGGGGADRIYGRDGDDILQGGDGDDILTGEEGDDTLQGDDGRDLLNGREGVDSLVGGAGDDWMYGDGGNDIFDGGAGNDQLGGGIFAWNDWSNAVHTAGNDTYLFGRGDGQDVIRDLDNTIGNADRLVFKAGISASDVLVSRDGNALVLKISGTTDQVRIDSYFEQDGVTDWMVEEIRFADAPGTVWTVADIRARVISGGSGNDILQGYAGNDALAGGDGNDEIYGRAGNDTLRGDADNDTLRGEAGNDSLIGGDGDDRLSGGVGDDTLDGGAGNDLLGGGSFLWDSWYTSQNTAGNDTYLFGRGDGQDEINDLDETVGNLDKIVFKTGVAVSDVLVRRDASALLFTIKGTTDQIKVANYFAGNGPEDWLGSDGASGWQIEEIRFIDAPETVWSVADVKARLLVGGSDDDALLGYATDDTMFGGDGSDGLYGRAGNDSLNGGAGGDWLVGGLGNDTYIVDNAGDVATENTNEGTDLVQASVSYTLGANLENLTLTGTATINATGNTLNNVLMGNGANNVLNGGAGADTLVGGLGNDTYVVDNAGDVVLESLNEGTDTVQSSVNHTLAANVENLVLTGTAAINATGNAQDNTLSANAGNNLLDGAAGNDTVNYGGAAAAVVVNLNLTGPQATGGSGSDTLLNIENLGGTAFNDSLTGNAGNNVLNGGAGVDTLVGGLGNDTYYVDNTGDVVAELAGEGTDTVNASISYTLGAHVENLTLTGTATAGLSGTGNGLDNVLNGDTGNNTLYGGAGGDKLYGGSGNDVLTGDAASETSGTLQVNTLVVYAKGSICEGVWPTMEVWVAGVLVQSFSVASNSYAAYTITAPLGQTASTVDVVFTNDAYNSAAKQDRNLYLDKIEVNGRTIDAKTAGTLVDYGTGAGARDGHNLQFSGGVVSSNSGLRIGLAGNDYLNGGAGADTMVGGYGNDQYVVDSADDVVLEGVDAGLDMVTSSVSYVLSDNLEVLDLSGTLSINATGNSANNTLHGNAGNNRLDGLAGADVMTGAAGDDTYVVDNVNDVAWESAATNGTDTVESGVTYTLGNYVDNLVLTGTAATNGTGNGLDNALTGNGAVNTLTGGAGNDRLDGSAGNDTLAGGTGNDHYLLSRGYGADTINENDATAGNTDVAVFGAGITTDQLWFTKAGNNLDVAIIGTSDKFSIGNWYLGNQYHVEQFKTSDGKTLLDSQVQNLVQAMAGFAPPAAGQTTLSAAYASSLTPVIAANWQ